MQCVALGAPPDGTMNFVAWAPGLRLHDGDGVIGVKGRVPGRDYNMDILLVYSAIVMAIGEFLWQPVACKKRWRPKTGAVTDQGIQTCWRHVGSTWSQPGRFRHMITMWHRYR